MGTQVIKNRPVWINGVDFGNAAHSLALNYGADEKEATTLNNDTHIFRGGLKALGVAMDGYWDEQTSYPVDSNLFAGVGAINNVMTFSTTDGSEGEVGYFMEMLQTEYSPDGDIGEMFSFTVNGGAAGSLIRGTIELNLAAVLSSSNSTGRQLGAVSSGQSVYAAMHVTSVSGSSPTLDAIVQSDDNGSFSSPTSRITFTQAVDETSEILSTAGAITDDYWRVNYTIGGGSPSFTFIIVIGIL